MDAKVLVNVELGITDKTARTALNMVNLYLEQSDMELAKKVEDGEVRYVFIKRTDGNMRISE